MYRKEDIDLDACLEKDILVLGTNERYANVDVLSYVGVIAMKLVLAADVEVYQSNITILGAGVFAQESQKYLLSAGANVTIIPVSKEGNYDDNKLKNLLIKADILLIAESICKFELLGASSKIKGKDISCINSGVVVAHIIGNIDQANLVNEGVLICPDKFAPPGYMSVTTAYAGPAPIIRLHAAGLKVGQIMHAARVAHSSREEAIKQALTDKLCQDFENVFLS